MRGTEAMGSRAPGLQLGAKAARQRFSATELQALYRRLNVSSAFYTRGNRVTEQEGDVAPGSSGIQGTPFRAGSVLRPLAASDTEGAASKAWRMPWGLFGQRYSLPGCLKGICSKSSWELLVDTGGPWGQGGGECFQGSAML